MMKCITCAQPLPEGTEEHPGYFAQSELRPDASNPLTFVEEVENLLSYVRSLFVILAITKDIAGVDDDSLRDLHTLGWCLGEEAQRRFYKVREACELQYRLRKEAHNHRKEA